MPNCFGILNQIFERSGLNRKDGHPLYRYRVTSEELDQLQTELKFLFHERGTLQTSEECGAFCLFGAEWFRRNYQSGPWKWDVIFDALDLHGTSQPATLSVYAYVERGLKFWNVRLLSSSLMRMFLRTIVCQGGFPINTLRNDGAGLSRMLKASLRDHERYPTESMDEILSRYIQLVPLTLQTGEVRRLAVDLVHAIARLRKQSDNALSVGLTRTNYLDQNFSGWEVELPLRVEESEAKEILLSLLDASKAEPFSRHALALSTSLSLDGAESTIVRSLRCPGSLTEDEFRRVCKFKNDELLRPRMTGYLQSGETRVAAVAISRSSDGQSFRLLKNSQSSVNGSQAYQETALVLAVGGEEIQRIALPGGEELPESPWVFTTEEPHQLIGVGSSRPRDESILIAVPPNGELTPGEGSVVEHLDREIAGRVIVRVSGELTIRCDDLTYKIVTRSTNDRDCLYELRGNRRRLGTGGSEVWCGLPTVMQIPLDDTAPTEVPRNELQWKPVGSGTWSSNFSDCLGYVHLRVCHDQETKYLVRCIVVPAEIKIRVVPGTIAGTGELRISGLGRCRLAVEHLDGLEIDAKRVENLCVIKVNVSGERPNLLRMQFVFDNGNDCKVAVVCPTRCHTIVDATGRPVPYSSGIPAENLDGLTVQVIQPGDRVPLVYWPDGPLLIDRMRETSVAGVYEFPLSYISSYATELLACSDDPDGSVRFGVGESINFQPNFRWHVARHSHALDRVAPLATIDGNEDSTDIYVRGTLDLNSDVYDELTFSVVPLGSPNEEMPIESIDTIGRIRWRVRHSDYAPGYYLAVARDLKGNCLRPLRFVVKANELALGSADDRAEFMAALNTYDKEERQQTWDRFFEGISKNLAHSDWSRIDDLVNASETLPITTFEAVAALTRNHFAAARYGILYPHKERMWRRFEQLPFLWSAIPIQHWLIAAAMHWDYVERTFSDAGFPIEQTKSILERQRDLFAKEAPNRSRHMSCIVLAMFASNRFGIEFGQINIQQLTRQVRERERDRLDAHHDRFDTRSTWPSFRINYEPEEESLLQTASLLIEDGFDNQWSVLNGPAIAAVKSVYGNGLKADEISEYKRLRALDAEWYDTANAVAMSELLSYRCRTEPKYFENVLGDLAQ